MNDYKQTRDAAGKVTARYEKMLRKLHDDLTCTACGEYVGSPIADRLEAHMNALHIAKETLQTLAYWFDADEELLETMPPLERADNERLLNLIRHTRKEIRRLTMEKGNPNE